MKFFLPLILFSFLLSPLILLNATNNDILNNTINPNGKRILNNEEGNELEKIIKIHPENNNTKKSRISRQKKSIKKSSNTTNIGFSKLKASNNKIIKEEYHSICCKVIELAKFYKKINSSELTSIIVKNMGLANREELENIEDYGVKGATSYKISSVLTQMQNVKSWYHAFMTENSCKVLLLNGLQSIVYEENGNNINNNKNTKNISLDIENNDMEDESSVGFSDDEEEEKSHNESRNDKVRGSVKNNDFYEENNNNNTISNNNFSDNIQDNNILNSISSNNRGAASSYDIDNLSHFSFDSEIDCKKLEKAVWSKDVITSDSDNESKKFKKIIWSREGITKELQKVETIAVLIKQDLESAQEKLEEVKREIELTKIAIKSLGTDKNKNIEKEKLNKLKINLEDLSDIVKAYEKNHQNQQKYKNELHEMLVFLENEEKTSKKIERLNIKMQKIIENSTSHQRGLELSRMQYDNSFDRIRKLMEKILPKETLEVKKEH